MEYVVGIKRYHNINSDDWHSDFVNYLDLH